MRAVWEAYMESKPLPDVVNMSTSVIHTSPCPPVAEAPQPM